MNSPQGHPTLQKIASANEIWVQQKIIVTYIIEDLGLTGSGTSVKHIELRPRKILGNSVVL